MSSLENTDIVKAKYKDEGGNRTYYFWNVGSFLMMKIYPMNNSAYIPSYSYLASESEIPSDATEATIDLL